MTPIVDFPGYHIDESGNVYSDKSKKFLKPKPDGNGYFQYALRKDGKTYYRKRYWLVAYHFIDTVPEDGARYDIHHYDESTDNDHVSNLRIVSHRYNICVVMCFPIEVTEICTGKTEVKPEGFNHWCREMGWVPKNAAGKFSRDGKYKGFTFKRTGERYD